MIKQLRQGTVIFINDDPRLIALQRSTVERTAAGGQKRSALTALPPQRFRIIPQQDLPPLRQEPDGVGIRPEFVLLGVWDADMSPGDTFTLDAVEYVVNSVKKVTNNSEPYETKGSVYYRGKR